MTDRDIIAIASWERADAPDPSASGPGLPYRCTACDWTGRGETALRHFRATGHAIRGRDWPASWPDAQFSAPPPLISVCSWCDADGTRTAALHAMGRDVTHGICDEHAKTFMERR